MQDHFRLATFNLASWISTIVSMELLKDLGQLVALGCSIMVSMASLWWIARQAKSLDRKDKESK